MSWIRPPFDAWPEQMMGSKSRMQGKVPSQRSAAAPVYIGIDVCKARLDVHIHPLGESLVLPNDAGGLKRLKKILARYDVVLVVMEATGKFHRPAHRSLHASGFKVAIVNPLRSRRFAEAIGTLAKTDRVDARMLALMGESLKPGALEPTPELMETLQELARGRESAVDSKTAIGNQIQTSNSKVLVRELKRQLSAVETAIENLEAELERQIDADPVLARRFEILTSIPGIGLVAAVALIVELNEIGRLSSKEAAMIVGLAPIACDSGQKTGRREIRGGRKHLRTALYMPANSAKQHNPDLKIFHDRLIKAGKLAKVAITAVMRKLLVLANTLVREDRLWQPKHVIAR
jgi:transposase